MTIQLTAVYVKQDDWYVAYIEEIPGVNTQGRTKDEARENLEDALQLFLEANRELAREGVSSESAVDAEPFALIEKAA